jgi:DNA-binding Xre family transcriptional regulator
MKRALVAAIAAALTTAAVLSASGLGATTSRKAKSRSHHAHRAGATGATGAQGAKPTGPPPTMAEALATMQKQRDAQQKKLADALGVSVEKLQSAMDAVEAKHLADEVKNNRLTQAQADAIKACKKAPLTCDRSNLPAFGGHGGPGGPGPMGGHRGDRGTGLTDLATELGVTVAKLKTALQANRPQGPRFGGPGEHGPDGDGPHGGGPGGPPKGGFGGGVPQGGSYPAPPPAVGTGA